VPGRTITMSQWIAGFAVIARDIASNNLEGRAVVCTTLSGEKPLEYWQCKTNF